MPDPLYINPDTGEVDVNLLSVTGANVYVGQNQQNARYLNYGSNVVPPSSDGLINGVNITALNKRTRTSGAGAVDVAASTLKRLQEMTV